MVIATSIIPSDRTDTDHFSNLRKSADEYRIHHAPLTSNVLLATTGTCLSLEASSHFVQQPFKTVVRALIGETQVLAGLTGIGHYGLKFYKDPSLHNALGLVGSALFAGEGACRIAEAENVHLRRTSAFGFWAAATKCANGGPLTSIPYGLDAICNGAEYVHGTPTLSKKGLLGVAHELTYRWRTADLAGLQRNTGMVMIAIAAFKTLHLVADRDPVEVNRQAFEKMVNDTYDKMNGNEWGQVLDAAAQESEAALQAKLEAFIGEMTRELPTVSHKFAHVLESSPGDAKRLLERFPGPGKNAVNELREADPSRYAEIRERYAVDQAFGKTSASA